MHRVRPCRSAREPAGRVKPERVRRSRSAQVRLQRRQPSLPQLPGPLGPQPVEALGGPGQQVDAARGEADHGARAYTLSTLANRLTGAPVDAFA
ncbi:hypothetical protein ACFXA0_11575 [Streptomyces cyaneofuscatus]|uniref:hypothetical protein n=1 Tax=Streptomyces cyaneofuscatus TaxID=66883 RepID=UPI00367D67D8